MPPPPKYAPADFCFQNFCNYQCIFLNLASPFFFAFLHIKPISGRVDRASATEAVNSGSIPGRVKPKTIKIDIHSFPA